MQVNVYSFHLTKSILKHSIIIVLDFLTSRSTLTNLGLDRNLMNLAQCIALMTFTAEAGVRFAVSFYDIHSLWKYDYKLLAVDYNYPLASRSWELSRSR